MNILRACKTAISLPLAVFALLVGIDNVIDYESNYRFVQHTLSMDTVFPENALKWRAITQPIIWQLAYGAIIFAELLTGLLFLIGFFQLLRNLNHSQAFTHAKNWIYLGGTTGFFVWFFGFMVIGGEWFDMWQSQQWNGIQSAFRFVVVLLLVMIFVGMPESDDVEAKSVHHAK